MKENSKLMIGKDFLDFGADYKTLPVYLEIERIMRTTNEPYVLVTPEIICHYIYGSTITYKLKEVRSAFEQLTQSNIVEKISDKIYKTSREHYFSNKFVYITIEEYKNIIQNGGNAACQILLYFARLLNTFDNNTKYSNYSEQYFIKTYKMSKNTITAYNKVLEDIGVITIISKAYNRNIYCRPIDYDSIGIKKSRSDANRNRSISIKYHNYIANPLKYTDEEVIALYNECVAYNNDMDNAQRLQPGDDFSKRKKDLSVFVLDGTPLDKIRDLC